jgi:hypothetical protein
MKYLKLFENFNKSDIDSICRKYDITNYTINEDGSIDVDGYVNLSHKKLTELPLKFRNVSGDFYCSYNQLNSLEGSPQSVGGTFYCNHNQLISLDGCPKSIGRHFFCDNNPCYSIYGEWIDTDRRDELMDMMKDYDFLRGNTINWYLLEAFFNDAGLGDFFEWMFCTNNKKGLQKYYTIED